jgi:predicted nucleotidyltransferase
MIDDEELNELISLIVSYAKPNRVLLFGSRACGQSRTDSDYDICILYDALPKRKLEVLQDLYLALVPFKGHSVDLLVYEAAAFECKAMKKGSFEAKISAEAIGVYCSP